MFKWILLGILTLAPTSAISNEEISSCACKNDNDLKVLENIDEDTYAKLEKYENDLICKKFESFRLDNKFRIDIVVCERDEDT